MVEIARAKYWMVVMMMVAIATPMAAQNQPCLQELEPCSSYVYSTRPPQSCCDLLKKVVADELPCLCAAFQDPTINSTVNIDTGLQLMKRCNINNVSPSMCSLPPPTSPSPPGGHSPAGPKGSNAVHRAIWIGMPGFLSLLFFFWSMMS